MTPSPACRYAPGAVAFGAPAEAEAPHRSPIRLSTCPQHPPPARAKGQFRFLRLKRCQVAGRLPPPIDPGCGCARGQPWPEEVVTDAEYGIAISGEAFVQRAALTVMGLVDKVTDRPPRERTLGAVKDLSLE